MDINVVTLSTLLLYRIDITNANVDPSLQYNQRSDLNFR